MAHAAVDLAAPSRGLAAAARPARPALARSALARSAAPWLALALLGACRRPATEANGRLYGCLCTYLTDFDDSARIEVDVCVPAAKAAVEAAAGCASDLSRNYAESCTCRPPGAACDPAAPGACRNR